MVMRMPLALACLMSAALHAQAVRGASIAIGLWGGGGPHSAKSGETWYSQNQTGNVFGEVLAAADLGGRIEPVVELDRALIPPADRVTICSPAPNGSCYGFFPDANGTSYGAGLRVRLLDRMKVGAVVGVSEYQDRWRFVDVEAALRLAGPLYISTHVRNSSTAGAGSGNLWFRTIGVGARLEALVTFPH